MARCYYYGECHGCSPCSVLIALLCFFIVQSNTEATQTIMSKPAGPWDLIVVVLCCVDLLCVEAGGGSADDSQARHL